MEGRRKMREKLKNENKMVLEIDIHTSELKERRR